MSEIEQLRKEINNCHVYLDECYVNDPATAPNEITLMVRLVALIKLVGELRAEIELWKTADSKAVAAARAESAKLYSVVESAWYQFAYVDGNGKRWCGGLSALEDIADALELDV